MDESVHELIRLFQAKELSTSSPATSYELEVRKKVHKKEKFMDLSIKLSKLYGKAKRRTYTVSYYSDQTRVLVGHDGRKPFKKREKKTVLKRLFFDNFKLVLSEEKELPLHQSSSEKEDYKRPESPSQVVLSLHVSEDVELDEQTFQSLIWRRVAKSKKVYVSESLMVQNRLLPFAAFTWRPDREPEPETSLLVSKTATKDVWRQSFFTEYFRIDLSRTMLIESAFSNPRISYELEVELLPLPTRDQNSAKVFEHLKLLWDRLNKF